MKFNFTFTGKVYDMLKWLALIFLPALGTFYFAMAGAWNLPYATQIVGTIAAIDVFLGVVLGISEAQYRMTNSYSLRNTLTDIADEAVHVSWVISSEAYDVLKWLANVVLPALATLYFALAQIWGLPMAEQVVATIMAIDTMLGMILQFSNSQYNKKAAYACLAD